MFINDRKPVCGAIELTTLNSCFAYLTPLIDCVAVAHLQFLESWRVVLSIHSWMFTIRDKKLGLQAICHQYEGNLDFTTHLHMWCDWMNLIFMSKCVF